jgi:hypothetical protein
MKKTERRIRNVEKWGEQQKEVQKRTKKFKIYKLKNEEVRTKESEGEET